MSQHIPTVVVVVTGIIGFLVYSEVQSPDPVTAATTFDLLSFVVSTVADVMAGAFIAMLGAGIVQETVEHYLGDRFAMVGP